MDIIKILKESELFLRFDTNELKIFAEHMLQESHNNKEILFEKNTKKNSLYLILKGSVELFTHDEFGTEKSITMFSKNDILGEADILEDYPHSASARVLKSLEVLRLTRESFVKISNQHPLIAGKLVTKISKIVSRKLRLHTNQVVSAAAQYMSGRTRVEHDLLGEKELPAQAYYGIQTLRAKENFPITGVSISLYGDMVVALANVKKAAARTNYEIGLLDENVYKAINRACEEVENYRFHTHFIVDVFQGGAGTSTNMNANEVIANRALEIMGYEKGDYQHCHPNNHVNLSQSTNDAYPTAIKIAVIYKKQKLIKALTELVGSFKAKAEEFKDIIKMGRTQLQDAVPMTLGQEFNAFADTLSEEIHRIEENVSLLYEINLGGTAIGTGINANNEYREKAVRYLSGYTGLPLKIASNLVEATSDTGAFVMFASTIKRLAIKLSKISSDLRLLSSGPRAGLNEINLPKVQPGSSIMPGKVNPVIPELVNQVAFNIIGNELTITMASEAGQLQLNVMEPVIARNLFETMDILKNTMLTFKVKCIDGITANKEVCERMVKNSIGIITALVPVLGYEVCSGVAKEALETGESVYKLILDKDLLSKEKLDDLLSVENMINMK